MTKPRRLFTADARFAVTPPTAGGPTTLQGYAIVWNAVSGDRGGYLAKIAPGTVKFEPTTHALYHHDYRDLLGSTASGSLRLSTDDYGVKVEIDLPDTTAGRDVGVLVARGDIRGMSFNMTTDPTGPIAVVGGQKIMTLDPFTLDEVTVTAIPAFTETSIDVKPPTADDVAYMRCQQAAFARLQLQRFQRLAGVPARRTV